MLTIKFIKNILFEGDKLCAIGRTGYPTKVFLRQGNLDGACAVYSLMMMLIFHERINREDLYDDIYHKNPQYLRRLKKKFLYGIRGNYVGGYSFKELCAELMMSFECNIPVKVYNENDKKFHMRIKKQLDARMPVQIGYSKPNEKYGHSVVAIGYTISGDILRLFCLDPAHNLPFFSVWNNVIDIHMNESGERFDYNHFTESKIYVDQILLIKDTLKIKENLPF